MEHGYDPLAYRTFCLIAHYRSQLNFTCDSLDDGATGRSRGAGCEHGTVSSSPPLAVVRWMHWRGPIPTTRKSSSQGILLT